jgi:hypothetical protein
MSLTEKVRRKLRELGEPYIYAVAAKLQLTSRKDYTRVRQTVYDLVKAGEAERLKTDEAGAPIPPGRPYRYRYLGRAGDKRGGVREKLWGAMLLLTQRHGRFTLRDCARLAEANLDYTRRYARYCKADGFIEALAHGNYRVPFENRNEPAPSFAPERPVKETVTVAPPAMVAEFLTIVDFMRDRLEQFKAEIAALGVKVEVQVVVRGYDPPPKGGEHAGV